MLTQTFSHADRPPCRDAATRTPTHLVAAGPTEPALGARLRSVPLFASLSDAALERVSARAAEIEVPPGMLLIERAHAASGVFVILDGHVTVELPPEEIRLGPSELVGELGILADGAARRSARVRAATHVRCVALNRSDFTELLETEPSFASAVASILARRLLLSVQ